MNIALELLLSQGWEVNSLEKKREIMMTVVDTIGSDEYFSVLTLQPVQITEKLKELGPVLRLQMLFNLINTRYAEMKNILYTVGCEIFKNLKMVDDFTVLDDLYLGDQGQTFYSLLPGVAFD